MSSFFQSSPSPEILFIFHNFAPAHIETKSGPAGKMRTNLWQGANTFIILSLPGAVSSYEKLHLSCHTTYGSYLLYESHYEHYVLIIFDVLGGNKQNFKQLSVKIVKPRPQTPKPQTQKPKRGLGLTLKSHGPPMDPRSSLSLMSRTILLSI